MERAQKNQASGRARLGFWQIPKTKLRAGPGWARELNFELRTLPARAKIMSGRAQSQAGPKPVPPLVGKQ